MILQALTRLYEDLAARGEIARLGWGAVKVSYALCLDSKGSITQIVPLMREVPSGDKTVVRPQVMELPAAVKRSSGIASNFLWDNAGYLLGIDGKGNAKRSEDCFIECKTLHHAILDQIDSDTARAILQFFDTWQPEQAEENPVVSSCLDALCKGANMTFRVNGVFAKDVPHIAAAWQAYYGKSEGPRTQCLVTGKEDVLEIVHPSISGVSGAQSSGAALVSFNAPAFCSYGYEQGQNAPVGKYAAFAYTTALNTLLSDRDNVQHIGDTTIVCWAEGADPAYQPIAMAALFGEKLPEGLTANDLRAAMKRLADGLPCDELALDPERPFYILGLAPNAARLSVRFFLKNTFGQVMRNVNEHYERLEIVKPKNDAFDIIPLWALLRESVNMNSRDKSPSPAMAGATARAIFSGSAYPASLLQLTMLRIRAERNITRGRAAIIKAYYLKNPHKDCPKEVLTVHLNQESTNIPYTLGRIFSVYEATQQAANPGINTTIKDRFFNSAASTPATIFPVLDNLYQKHLRKLERGLQVHYDRQIMELKALLGEAYPLRLTLPQQGSFNLGYYHQTQKRYTKKEEQ